MSPRFEPSLLFLLEHANLEAPLRKSLLDQVSHPSEPWRRVIDQQISNQQSFCLVYEDSQGQQQEFTVRYCEIRFWEKRFYLEALCDEAVDRSGLPELTHNRCFRLDRIINILPVSGSWQSQLECINVEFNVLGRLTKAYEPQPDDIKVETIDGVLHVVRRVSNTFWFIREILRYGENCVVTSPPSVREQLVEKLKELCAHYDIS